MFFLLSNLTRCDKIISVDNLHDVTEISGAEATTHNTFYSLTYYDNKRFTKINAFGLS